MALPGLGELVGSLITPRVCAAALGRCFVAADPEEIDFLVSHQYGVRTTPEGRSTTGIADADIDALIERVIAADALPDLTLATRVLDRALQWGAYALPGKSLTRTTRIRTRTPHAVLHRKAWAMKPVGRSCTQFFV